MNKDERMEIVLKLDAVEQVMIEVVKALRNITTEDLPSETWQEPDIDKRQGEIPIVDKAFKSACDVKLGHIRDLSKIGHNQFEEESIFARVTAIGHEHSEITQGSRVLVRSTDDDATYGPTALTEARDTRDPKAESGWKISPEKVERLKEIMNADHEYDDVRMAQLEDLFELKPKYGV